MFDLRAQIREGFLAEIRVAVAATAERLVEDEVRELVGEPWSRKGNNPLRRNGQTSTTIFLDGEPHLLRRPRVRDQDEGSEYPIESLRVLRSRDALDEDVKGRMVRGITTRDYEDTLTTLSDGLGLKKSAVSSAFKRAAQERPGRHERTISRGVDVCGNLHRRHELRGSYVHHRYGG